MQRINSADKRRLRSWLCDKHGGRCCYCGKTVGGAGTVDHYLPQALGGTNAKPNLRWACRPCNQQKGQMHPDEWDRRPPAAAEETAYQRKVRLLREAIQRRT